MARNSHRSSSRSLPQGAAAGAVGCQPSLTSGSAQEAPLAAQHRLFGQGHILPHRAHKKAVPFAIEHKAWRGTVLGEAWHVTKCHLFPWICTWAWCVGQAVRAAPIQLFPGQSHPRSTQRSVLTLLSECPTYLSHTSFMALSTCPSKRFHRVQQFQFNKIKVYCDNISRFPLRMAENLLIFI